MVLIAALLYNVPSMDQSQKWYRDERKTGLAVLVANIAVRLVIWNLYRPLRYSDSNAYFRLAKYFMGKLSRFDGTRPPAYPFVMAQLGADEQRIWALQLALGILAGLALFYIGWKLTGLVWFGGLMGGLHALNLQSLLFEAVMLTETLALTVVLVNMVVFIWVLKKGNQFPSWGLLALGVLASITWLIRYQFIMFPLLIGLFILVQRKNGAFVFQWRRAGVYYLPVAVLLGLWVGFVYQRFGTMSISPIGGYTIFRHVEGLVDLAPDEFAVVRDSYISYREAERASGNSHVTIWAAVPDLTEATGLGFYPLSRHVGSLAGALIRREPGYYLKSVFNSWVGFWKAPIYWNPQNFANPSSANILRQLSILVHLALVGINGLFLLAAVLAAGLKKVRRSLALEAFDVFLILVVLSLSVIQALMVTGENARFLVPLQPLVVLWVGSLALKGKRYLLP